MPLVAKHQENWMQCPCATEITHSIGFAISQSEREGLSKWKLRCLQEEKIRMIKKEIEAKTSVKTTMKYFISLPREEAHSGHPTGQAGVYAQKLTSSSYTKPWYYNNITATGYISIVYC